MSKRILVVEDQEDDRQIIRDIIAVTSYAPNEEEQKAREAGCDDFVPKPYSPRELLAKIRQYIPQ